MTARERDMMAETTCRRVAGDLERHGADAGASTALSTVVQGPGGVLYACAVTVLVHAITALPADPARLPQRGV